MNTLRITLMPCSAFATPPHGDTLFGQICWALHNRLGEAFLNQCLTSYTDNRPFLVVSDLFPTCYWPRPHLPPVLSTSGQNADCRPSDHKADKKRIWLPMRDTQNSLILNDWLKECQSEKEIWYGQACTTRPQPHNTINRLTNTTGEGQEGFAPYEVEQIWFPPGAKLDLWVVHDPARLTQTDLLQALEDIGQSGFGKDASLGMGQFTVDQVQPFSLHRQKNSNAWLTLGFCVPQEGKFDPARSFYKVFTRFGRHGDVAALSGQPFKNPILLMRAGAVLTPQSFQDVPFVGSGLGGNGTLSKAIPETVHQGYAPVVGIRVEF